MKLGQLFALALLLFGCSSDTDDTDTYTGTVEDSGDTAGNGAEQDADNEGTQGRDTDYSPQGGNCLHDGDDLTLQALTATEIDSRIRTCVMPFVLAGNGPGSENFVGEVSGCIAEELGVQERCSSCYAVAADCWFAGCGLICMPDPAASACTECRCGATGGPDCQSQLELCTGIATGICGG